MSSCHGPPRPAGIDFWTFCPEVRSVRGRRYNRTKKAEGGRSDRTFGTDKMSTPKTAEALAAQQDAIPRGHFVPLPGGLPGASGRQKNGREVTSPAPQVDTIPIEGGARNRNRAPPKERAKMEKTRSRAR
jgi:hypothetical protein